MKLSRSSTLHRSNRLPPYWLCKDLKFGNFSPNGWIFTFFYASSLVLSPGNGDIITFANGLHFRRQKILCQAGLPAWHCYAPSKQRKHTARRQGTPARKFHRSSEG